MKKNKPIPLFWWSEIEFISKNKENYGDLLSKYLVEKISSRPVEWVHPKKQPWYKWNKANFLAVGSIIHHATKDSVVWGSGIIDNKQKVDNACFKAVRGPKTREYLLNLGYYCPPVYGDPALLLPKFYSPIVEKKFKFGIIPHYHDFAKAKKIFEKEKEVVVIDLMTLDVEEVTWQIIQCEKTISSSLHGLIVSHAYNVPSVWVKFSNKIFGNDIKYHDYLESVGLEFYQPEHLQEEIELLNLEKLFSNKPVLPKGEEIIKIQNDLLSHCPFL